MAKVARFCFIQFLRQSCATFSALLAVKLFCELTVVYAAAKGKGCIVKATQSQPEEEIMFGNLKDRLYSLQGDIATR